MTLENTISRYVGQLVGSLSSTSTGSVTISPAPYKEQSDGTKVFMTEVAPILSANKQVDYANGVGAEKFRLNNGVENADGSATYDQVARGIPNAATAEEPTGHVNFQTNHTDPCVVIIDATYEMRALDQKFVAGSDNGTATVVTNDLDVGQPFEFVDQGDGTSKIKPFNGGQVGGVVTTAAAVDATATYQKITRGTFTGLTGHSGVGGEVAYADYTDATDASIVASSESPSVNAKPIGVFVDDSTVYLGFSVQSLAKASTAEAEAGTNDVAYMTPLKTKEATTADTDLVHTTGDESISGVKTFASSPIVPTGATGSEAISADDVDSKIPTSTSALSASISGSGTQTSSPDTGSFAHGLSSTPSVVLIQNEGTFISYTLPSGYGAMQAGSSILVGFNQTGGSANASATLTFTSDGTNVDWTVTYGGVSTGTTVNWSFKILAIL